MAFNGGYLTIFIKIRGIVYALNCHSCCILHVATLAEKEIISFREAELGNYNNWEMLYSRCNFSNGKFY